MLKRMSCILCGVILGCGISVFASTGEKESVGVVSNNDLEELSVSLDRAADVPGIDMDGYDEEDTGLTGGVESESVSGDGVSEKEEHILDEIVSANEVVEETDEIVSANEVVEEIDETVSADEISEEKKPEEAQEERENTVSGGYIDWNPEDEIKDETVVKVSFPEKIRISLDPKNLLGKGRIYSDEYKIVNYGNSDVVIRIKTTDVFYKDKEDAQKGSNAEMLDAEESPNVEDLDVKIVWGNEKNVERSIEATEGNDVYFLHLKASQYDGKNEFVKLGDKSEMSFRFTGEINGDPDARWNADDLGLQFSYKIVKTKDTEDQGRAGDLVKNEEISENENDQYRLE